ncbi:MAG: FHA domain-containing protein [Crinalium sp.]
MIVCPNCTHQNPEGATQCEACYTPLPTTTNCPSCGASVQTDATFCGQCGSSLKPSTSAKEVANAPDLVTPDPLVAPETLVVNPQASPQMPSLPDPQIAPDLEIPATAISTPPQAEAQASVNPSTPPSTTPSGSAKTQLQLQTSRLLHVQTNTLIELPQNLSVLHIGKPNDQIPPDIDVSGFPNSEIVSRIHADIRLEGDTYYLEDVGSANGTYINHTPLPRGNRHRLRPGDRISLGKGDMMTFLFQIA